MSNALRPRYLEVWLHGQHIGWLCEAGRVTRFVASEPYLTDKARRTISASMTPPGLEELTQTILNNHFNPAIYRERGELPPFFAGLMPEGALRRRLAATRKDARDMDDFGILAAAGEDLPGAVKVIPANLDNLTQSARAFCVTGGADNLETCVPEGAAEGAAALSGVQDKIALSHAKNGQRYCLPIKGTLSELIAKLPTTNDDSQIMNEYACMRLAELAGVEIARCRPQPMNTMDDHPDLVVALGEQTRFLAVDRFDRSPGGPIHMEDACQMLTLMPTQKYAGLNHFVTFIALLKRLSAKGISDVRQIFIRQAVNTLLGNSDAHLKNFSVLYRDGVIPELSPAYDIVCVSALPGFLGFATNVAIDKLQQTETLATYADVAKMAGVPPKIATTAVKQVVAKARELWPEAMREMEMPDKVREVISARLLRLPLAKGQ